MKALFGKSWVRWGVLGSALLGVLLLAFNGDEEVATVAQPVEKSRKVSKQKMVEREVLTHVELERLAPRGEEDQPEVGNVFKVTSWYVAPPPPPPPPPEPYMPPPEPTAPPMPFTYLGRYEDALSQIAILLKGDKVYNVTAGELIDNTYRLDRIAAGQLDLTYIPLNIKQNIRTGEAP